MKTKGVILLLCLCLLTGCSSIETTNQEDNEISEYIAGVLLKHDGDYKEGLVFASEEESSKKDDLVEDKMPATQKPVVSQKPNEESNQVVQTNQVNSDDKEQSDSNVSFGELVGNKNVKVQVADYGTYKSYPKNVENTYFTLDASKGKELLVAKLKLSNSSNSKQTFTTLKKEMSIKLKAGDKTYNSSLTLLENDFQFLNVSIDAKKSKTAVLVFEVPQNSSFKSIVITAANKDKIATLEASK